MKYLLPIVVMGGASMSGCISGASTVSLTDGVIHPSRWPNRAPVFRRDPQVEARIAALLERMSVEEKVGQIIQADIDAATPADAKAYHLGSVLNGGNSAPGRDVRAPAQAWLGLADAFWDASVDASDGRVAIPIFWGTDAVHGHNNIVGATIFPHNIGLGAANSPALLRQIGEVTAKEIRVTGLDWTFAPTLAVARDDRWGRTYESYSEDPEIVAAYAGAMVEGIQGAVGTDGFLGAGHVLATAKHFIGDGGTTRGRDQGDTRVSENELLRIHAAGYPAAISSGVQVVMASFSAFQGRRMHEHKELLTDVLVGRMGFDGFVVGDWNGHGRLPGCSADRCAKAVNAGIDMFMAPSGWKALHRNTVQDVKSGRISQARLNQAVSRVLRVKMRMGLFDAGRPSERPFAGQWDLLNAPAHQALARRAVRESLVLLKNDGGVLPIKRNAKVLVAGHAADDIGLQCGGWTLSWQGTGNATVHFPHGQSVYDALRSVLVSAGGQIQLSEDGTYEDAPDVAIVVFGERPYAEFEGDIDDLDYRPQAALRILQRLKAAGIKTVSVFLSGRPLWVNPELNSSDAFVAAWLPGDQGSGIADVLIAKGDGSVHYDFSGRLSFSWPASPVGDPVNRGDERALFPYGYGLRYADSTDIGPVSESDEIGRTRQREARSILMARGDAGEGWRLALQDATGRRVVTEGQVTSPEGHVVTRPIDDRAQEDARQFTWTGSGSVLLDTVGQPVQRPFGASQAIVLRYRVLGEAVGDTRLAFGCQQAPCPARLDVTSDLDRGRGQGWRTRRISLRCFTDRGLALDKASRSLLVTSTGPLTLEVSSVEVVRDDQALSCGL